MPHNSLKMWVYKLLHIGVKLLYTEVIDQAKGNLCLCDKQFKLFYNIIAGKIAFTFVNNNVETVGLGTFALSVRLKKTWHI